MSKLKDRWAATIIRFQIVLILAEFVFELNIYIRYFGILR